MSSELRLFKSIQRVWHVAVVLSSVQNRTWANIRDPDVFMCRWLAMVIIGNTIHTKEDLVHLDAAKVVLQKYSDLGLRVDWIPCNEEFCIVQNERGEIACLRSRRRWHNVPSPGVRPFDNSEVHSYQECMEHFILGISDI